MKLLPRGPPQPDDRRIAGAPLVGELLKAQGGHLGVDRGVDRAQVTGQFVPVLAAGVAEGVAD